MSARHPLSLALLLTCIAACTTWRTQAGTPSQVLAAKHPSVIRVTRAGGAVSTLHQPLIRGDTLYGWPVQPSGTWHSDSGGMGQSAPLRIPLADIRFISVQQVSAGKTVLLVAGVGLTAALVAAAASSDQSSGGGGGGDGSGNELYSCPLVYSWDGREWRLDSGTFGGAITRGLARTDVDNLAYAVADNGNLRLKVANELAETDYLDAISVLAVDAPAGTEVAPDASGRLHGITAPVAPVAARDRAGRDALARVRDRDGWQWESSPAGRDSSRTADTRDGLELSFVRPSGAEEARLVLDANNTPWAAALMGRFVAAHGAATQAWYDSLDASPELARRLGARLARQAFLDVQVRTGDRWVSQGLAWEAGPEVSKRQVVPLDLAGVEGDTVRVRLESVPSFWLIDRAALDFSPELPLAVHELRPDGAPASVAAIDGVVGTLRTGDSLVVSFRTPPVPPGTTRSYLLRSHGWYRIDAPESGPPDVALLEPVLHGSDGLSRVATARLSEAVTRLNRGR